MGLFANQKFSITFSFFYVLYFQSSSSQRSHGW